MTPFGKICFEYRYVQVKKKHFSPLLEELGIETKTRIFIESCRDSLEGCLFTSFRKALKLGGGEFSVMTLWNRFQEWGEKVIGKEREAFEFVSAGERETGESPYDVAYVMIDGIWEQLQTSKRTLITDESVNKKKPGHFEMKTCRLVLGKVENGGMNWTEPFVHANNCSSQAFLKECRDFLDSVFQLYNVKNIVLVSDAASWIKKFCDFYPRAVHQLDWWHLWKKAKTFHYFCDDKYEKLWSLLKGEKADEAVMLVREVLKSLEDFTALSCDRNYEGNKMFKIFQKREKKWLERRRKEVQELLSYIENNRECIYGLNSLPPDLPPDAFIRGSGPVEKLQGTLLGYRMKKQGRSWSKNGANNMAALLCQWFNGDVVREKIDDLCRMKEEWELENDRLESIGNHVPEVVNRDQKPPFSPFNAIFPILERGKTDTGMFGFLRGIREPSCYAG